MLRRTRQNYSFLHSLPYCCLGLQGIFMIRTLKSPSSPAADTCNVFFVTKTEYGYEKILIVAILQLATSLSYAEEVAITLRSYKIALRHDLKSGSPETRLGWTHISNFLQLISSRHPAVSLIQRRISLISGSPAHCKMDTHTVRRTA